MPLYWDAYYYELALKHQARIPGPVRQSDRASHAARILRAGTWIVGVCGVIAGLAYHAQRLG